MKFFLAITFFCLSVSAETLEGTINIFGYVQIENSASDEESCSKMSGHHLLDIRKVDKLYEELMLEIKKASPNDSNVKSSLKIKYLLSEIKRMADIIRHDSVPEWNTEAVPMFIKWHVSRSDFFTHDNELQNLRNDFLQSGNMKAMDWRRLFVLLAAEGYFVDVDIDSSQFLGEENQNVKEYFRFEPCKFQSCELEIVYQKKVTWLEYCQFLKTLHFEVDVSYVMPNRKNFFDEPDSTVHHKTLRLFVHDPHKEKR